MASSSSSASPSPSAPTFSSQPWKYHVFLSFRGEDTRKTFVDHLYSALDQQGIYTWKDGETLPRGESIGPSLLKAIEESQIAVIIFSENYADSSWCLDELAYIMKCKDTKGQIVIPIFYDVEPCVVRKQKQKYGKALAKHELENRNKVKSWRRAFLDDPCGWLTAPQEQKRRYQEAFAKHKLENKTRVESWRKTLMDASNISGWELKHIANGHESKVIKEIIDAISQKLQLVTSCANENLIGMAARMQRLRSELLVGSGDVRIVGIWGVGGGGKTTLASSIYDEISINFDGCCFVKDIREESSKKGLEILQEKIFCGVLKQTQVPVIRRAEEGRCMIRDRLCHRKVLIVLDDVDHLDQLKALAGSHDWFGEGSRIIITTRDVHILNAHKVDVMHNIILLNDNEAIKLFRKLSPQHYRPKEDYERLLKEVVSYAGGLPLAITVLGSFLCDKDIDEWRSALARLKEIPNDDIVGKLKISYDGLTKVEKDLFLDIACFFLKELKDTAMAILDSCGFHPVIGVKVLIQKSLIIVYQGRFYMHDLVQEMGHYIVRGEHPNNPEKHTRVWKREDFLKICAMDATMELDKIEAIQVGLHGFLKIQQELPPISANMNNLRYIESEAYNAKSLLNIPPRELCCLILYYGLDKQLWEGCKLLPNLKIMELWNMSGLMVTPDFGGVPNLERFKVHRCYALEEIHPSIVRLDRLVFLSIEHCWYLKMFPSFTQPKKLETLSFRGCFKIFKFSEIRRNMDNLPHLHMDNSGDTQIKKPGEDLIDVEECCLEEPCLPHNNMNHIGLRSFLKDLRNLDLGHCGLGDEEMGSTVWELPNLKKLNLKRNKFSRLSFSHFRLPQLKCLDVSTCGSLVELSELPSSIATVRADNCSSLESFGDISNCKWLWNVSLLGYHKFGPPVPDILSSMLQGNAIEDYFMSFSFEHQIPMEFAFWVLRGNLVTWRLPRDWYDDYCGILIHVSCNKYPEITINFKREVDEDPSFEQSQESNEAPEPEYDGKVRTYVGYVSFSSLRQTTSLNSSYNIVSFSIEHMDWGCFESSLIRRKSEDDPVQTTQVATDPSEYWDEDINDTSPFTIRHDSYSFIQILWKPPVSLF